MKFYLVGGAVRDKLLGLNIRDKDWVVVGSTYKEMIRLGFKPVGNYFPVFLHPITKEEYALARTEKKSGYGYNGFICKFSKNITLKQDLFRRDLTINAIALDNKGNYYDPFNGILDINNRVIRHISIFFSDDPLRVLRVAQFYSRFLKFNFTIASKTLLLMTKISLSGELLFLTPERIWIETKKVFKNFNIFWYFYILHKCQALKIIFPELCFLFQNNKLLNYFYLISNRIFFLKYGIEINFVFLCFFFYKTILSKKYFLDKNLILYKVKNFCKRLCIPKKFFILFKFLYIFLLKIFFLNKKNFIKSIIDLFYEIDIWRRSDILSNILKLIKILQLFPFKNKNLFLFFNNYLLDIFNITNSIKSKYIMKFGIQGIKISEKLYDLRFKKIYFFLKKNNLY